MTYEDHVDIFADCKFPLLFLLLAHMNWVIGLYARFGSKQKQDREEKYYVQKI